MSGSSTWLQAYRRIDEYCQQFESAWKAGEIPRIEDYLGRIEAVDRKYLLRELLILEMNYRRDEDGESLSDAQLCELHPSLLPDISEELTYLRNRLATDDDVDMATHRLTVVAENVEPTIDHNSHPSGSRGLRIRCPHCSNAVELLGDTPLASITCRTCGSAFSLVDDHEHTRVAPTLKRIGRFELVSRLGVGGFGTVWKARDTELERSVAVKIPRKGQLERAEVEQFIREARSAAQLRHPNIVPVHEVGRDGETIFIVSDLIRGISLADWLSGAKPSANEVASMLATISEALEHAHQKGVVHRDLKPSNILLDEAGQPHIMDFGLAKRELGEVTMTVDGQVLGTPAYMSPEQAAGKGHWIDRRTDIYSLGVLMFRMLTGELPFRGNAQMQIHQRLTEDAPDPRKLNRHITRDLSVICMKCLERDPAGRYSTSKDLADELRRCLRREPIQARPVSRLERLIRWSKRNPSLAWAASITAALAIFGPVAAVRYNLISRQLQSRVAENENLIDRYQGEMESSGAKIAELRKQLDVWEGKSNPSSIWPSQGDFAPRNHLIKQFFEHSRVALGGQLRAKLLSDSDAARGYMALGCLAQSTGQSSDAIQYYSNAVRELEAVSKVEPSNIAVQRALAACHLRLGDLLAADSRNEATKNLELAASIHKKLAVQNPKELTPEIELIESELSLAVLQGYDSSQSQLAYVDQLRRALQSKWPSDPNSVYQIACYLTRTQPLFAVSLPREAGNDKDVEIKTAPE